MSSPRDSFLTHFHNLFYTLSNKAIPSAVSNLFLTHCILFTSHSRFREMHTSFNVIKYPKHLLELAKVASQSRPVYQEKVQSLIREDKVFCYVSKLLLGNSWKTLILKTDRYHLFDLLLSSFIHRKVQGVYLSGNVAIYSPFLESFINQFSNMTISSNPRLKIFLQAFSISIHLRLFNTGPLY